MMDACTGFRDQKVAGSNPVTSTTKVGRFAIAYQLFLMHYMYFSSFQSKYIVITLDNTGLQPKRTHPDCNGLLTDSVWQGLVLFGTI